ncbi:MAG: chitobiase/beta-hexosaminidase C-terminal domain-containing protein, partial [Candidatus Omnitrophica bacterium]|nr:chitobiase/beta-hexosaminidase C-terminal domain-containing protein [Candidatus Omnitrophota bacterium]
MKPIGAGNLHPYIFQAIRNHIFLSFFICFPLLCHGAEEALFISEFMADGNRTLADEDGEYPDWIELFNSGVDTVNLNGWHLTDDPGNLTKWTFPDIDLPAGRCLLVFASGKDRANADSPLHTNFRLEIEGEYLALLKPGGQTIVHEYAPYPSQNVPKDGYSYGLRTHAVSFLSNGAPVRVHVPEAADSGDSWTSPSFDDSSWQAAELGVGFGTLSGKLAATLYEANMTVDSLSAADRVIADKSLQKRVVFEETNVINYFDNDEDGHFIDNSPFPGHQTNENIDDFVLLATGVIIIPESGTWTFGINSDDGARLRIDDRDVIVDDTTHAVQDALASISLTAGRHTIELVYFERSGGAELELFAAKGQYSSFQSRRFNLVGDEENGGIGLEGFSSLIHYDARDVMAGKNASIFLRIPFEVDDPSLHYNLVLRMRYNDGFAAYINGREIARRNAPDPLDWNSAALEERPFSDSLAVAELNLPDSSNLLQDGTNILAIHGLNYAPADENFLIQAELTGSIIFADDPRYFMPPTPGSQNGAGVSGFVEDVVFSQDHGFYDEPFTVTLATQTENAAIRYTTDCTDPTESNGTLYTGPITIDRLTPLRAAAFKPGFEPSRISTQTYIFLDDVLQQVRPEGYPSAWGNNVSADYGMDPDVINDPRYRDTIRDDLQSLPVMSLVSEPDYFFGSRDGIYTHPENKGIAWERPCSTEFFFPDGSREGFQVNNGIRIQGGYSRIPDRRKHSFRMLFKRDYGPPTLRCKMFDNSPVEKFDQLVLRGGYNYTWHSHEGGFGS